MIVECRSVSKQFPERLAVDGLELEVSPGLCFGVLGPNGAGKTTTLKMVYGVMPPSAGSVRVFGTDVTANPRAVRARLGVTLQENSFIVIAAFTGEMSWILLWDLAYIVVASGLLLAVAARVTRRRLSS